MLVTPKYIIVSSSFSPPEFQSLIKTAENSISETTILSWVEFLSFIPRWLQCCDNQ